MRRAVFLDRDGTLIEEAGYLEDLDRVSLFPYSVDAVRQLGRAGLAVVIVTNQSGVARGIVREDFVTATHQVLSQRLEAGGARVDGFYYCPHHPEGIVETLRITCDCRKPKPGLLRRAASELDLDLARSFTIGDRWHDVEAGRAAGTQTILVRTGYGRSQDQEPPPGAATDAVVDNLAAAAAWLLSRR